MKESLTDKALYIDRIRSWARGHAYGGSKRPTASNNSKPVLPLDNPSTLERQSERIQNVNANGIDGRQGLPNSTPTHHNATRTGPDSRSTDKSAASASEAEGTGPIVDKAGGKKKPNIIVETYLEFKKVLFHSWINIFLVFVPVGIIIANIPNKNAGATFGINAVAIIPLAALLSHATESVARKMGDTVGALLNVTFGNAVELIIFIALVKGEIRIVQASLLGSILANLLLILGMAIFLGGLRFREQVGSLFTAFHASFKDKAEADSESLKISHGVSVLKSHSYMYESTPQHIIDEEATPGPAAAWLEASGSDSSSSSDSDSDNSSHSRETMSKRIKRTIRGHRRRKSSVASADTDDGARTRTSSLGTGGASPAHEGPKSDDSNGHGLFPRMNSQGSEEAIKEEDDADAPRKHHKRSKHKHRRRDRKALKHVDPGEAQSENIVGLGSDSARNPVASDGEPRRVDFANTVANANGPSEMATSSPKRPFNQLRGISLAKSFAPTVFTQQESGVAPQVPPGPVPRVRYGIRRTNSLPERLNQYQYRPPGAMMPSQVPVSILTGSTREQGEEHEDDLSRGAAIIMLLVSTALVATCAEFMVDAIDAVVENSALKETFIGLIILPIVGNAAEHVTAVAVAMKNKMDLAIGVAIGSSIQIALFLTPLVVIIGWIIGQPMTLYFTLFETVCLFVSAFIINFLILDGRSNYLEGALLCATYVIIAVVAFFYPEGDAASALGA
ncbi:hypothetical protein AAE478_009843 [Parahypoxylon ruwenzoriense]